MKILFALSVQKMVCRLINVSYCSLSVMVVDAVILARGGSKGIPKKEYNGFLWKPLNLLDN